MMFHLSCIELHQIYVSVPVVEKLAAGLIYLVSKLRGTDFNTLFEAYSPATVKISLYKSNNCVFNSWMLNLNETKIIGFDSESQYANLFFSHIRF